MLTVGFPYGVNVVFTVMGYYTLLIGSWLPAGKHIGPTMESLILEYGTDKLSQHVSNCRTSQMSDDLHILPLYYHVNELLRSGFCPFFGILKRTQFKNWICFFNVMGVWGSTK